MFAAPETRMLGSGPGGKLVPAAPLYLNVLPVRLGPEPGHVFVAKRDDERDRTLRDHPGAVGSFKVYGHLNHIYVWAAPDGHLPKLDEVWRPIVAAEVPREVVAFAVREEAIARLVQDHNFTVVSGRLDAPARLYRRRLNLAAFPGLEPDPRAAIFPLVLIQAITLGDETVAASTNLLLDARTIQRVGATLAELADAGVSLANLTVRWEHADDCNCAPLQRGRAGSIVGGDPRGELTLSRRGTFPAAARCLRANANAALVARYLARLSGRPAAEVEKRLAAAVHEGIGAGRLWELLVSMQHVLNPLTVLGGVTASLDQPCRIGDDVDNWPRCLAPATEPQLNFRYGAELLSTGAGAGLRKFGPYDQATSVRAGRLRALVIAPREFDKAAQRLTGALANGLGTFRGMQTQFKLDDFSVSVELFDGDNADAYRREAARIAELHERPDLVFPIVRSSGRYLPLGSDPYKAAKAILAGRDIPSQSITVELLAGADSALQWSLSSAALAAYAKVGNVPYVLHDADGAREIVIGIGRADTDDAASSGTTQLYGCTVVFRQDGDFLYGGSTVPVSTRVDYEQMLAEQIREAAETFEREQAESLERIVVHVFKRTGAREVRAARSALQGRAAVVALLHVNRDAPLRLLRVDNLGVVTTPEAGMVVALGPRDRLLVTGEAGAPSDGHPLRLTLDPTSTYVDLDRLVAQAYGLAAVSWRGYRRSGEPVTISYGHALASKVGALRPYGFDPTGLGRRPWFL